MERKREIIDSPTITRSLKRISHEILEKNKGVDNIVIIGIKSKGVYMAKRITEMIKAIEGDDVPFGELDITFYRDDIKHNELDPIINQTNIPVSVEGKKVILVDDVLYTGRTVRAALDAIMDHGRASEIQLAILIDRGHRELPIRPDYIGKNIPTSRKERVIVELSENNAEDRVLIIESS